jgi:Flp pilus assembly protein TadD
MQTKRNRELRRARKDPRHGTQAIAQLLGEAGKAYSTGDQATAEQLAQRVISIAPSEPNALNILGVIAAGRGDAVRAAEIFSEAVRTHPQPGPVHANLALALKLLGRWREAVPHARESVRLQPENPINWNTLCATCYELGDYDSARAAGRAAVCLEPKMSEAWANLGNALAEVEGSEFAKRAFRAALVLNPLLSMAWSGYGTAHLAERSYAAAFDSFARSLALRRASQWWPGSTWPPGFSPPSRVTNTVKLRHDVEQIAHDRASNALGPEFDGVLAAYKRVLDTFVAEHGTTPSAPLKDAQYASIASTYGRIYCWHPPAALSGGAIASDWNRAAVEQHYAIPPGVCWVDGLLKPEALDALRRFCMEATIWNDTSHNFQADQVARGYLGTYVNDGFAAPLLFQIAEELTSALPGIFRTHTLRQMWAYKYEERLEGIGIHGDDAAINVNFWITPDEANLDPDGGGLLVYPKEAPTDWDFGSINTDPARIHSFLEASGVAPINIPYRRNRAVIFNSDLFHSTAPLRFQPGYDNRRINITMLFGRRH